MNSNIDYNQPQKQSVKGLLVLFVYQFQEILRQFWIPLLYLFFKLNFKEHPEYYLAILGLIILVFLIAYLKFVNYTFHINSKQKEFVIEEGVFNKTKLSIPLNKIQQVNINQSFIQKLVDVYSLSIDTAGSDKNEVKIKALNLGTAQFLKNELMEISKSSFLNEDTKIEEKIVFKTSIQTLLKVAFTSQYGKSIAILLGFMATIYNTIDDLERNFDLDSTIIDQEVSKNNNFNSILILIVFLLIVVFLINIINVFVKYYNFSITKILD
jgi:putative membrane protein